MHASDVGGWSNRSLPLLCAFDRILAPGSRRVRRGDWRDFSTHDMRRLSCGGLNEVKSGSVRIAGKGDDRGNELKPFVAVQRVRQPGYACSGSGEIGQQIGQISWRIANFSFILMVL